jgi:hypothetical protein
LLEEVQMPATNPRITSVVGKELFTWLRGKADRQGISVSLLVRDLLMRLRDEDEEQLWAAQGEQRLATFDREKAFDHEDAWR